MIVASLKWCSVQPDMPLNVSVHIFILDHERKPSILENRGKHFPNAGSQGDRPKVCKITRTVLS